MNDITKLPKWAQEHIKTLTAERDIAVRTLRQFSDQQALSPISYREHYFYNGENGERSPKVVTRYVATDSLTVNYGGVTLDIILRPANSGHVTNLIDLQYRDNDGMMVPVMLQPVAFQKMYLFKQ
jgi:hypothetical protein